MRQATVTKVIVTQGHGGQTGTKLQTLDVFIFFITFMAVVGPAAFVSSGRKGDGGQMETKLPVLDVLMFVITFMSVITIGSKFVPKAKPKKDIIDKRSAREAQLKEARSHHTRGLLLRPPGIRNLTPQERRPREGGEEEELNTPQPPVTEPVLVDVFLWKHTVRWIGLF
jgi:hypothetical protein